MARTVRTKKPNDFGLGKPTAQEKATAQKMANMAQGKPSARNNASAMYKTSSTSGTKKLSAAMYHWAKANKDKLKDVATPAQKKIFEKYKAMVKAGDNPANPKPKTKKTSPTTTTTTKPANVKQEKPDKKPENKKSKGSGVTGSFRQSNPPSPTVTAKPKKGRRTRVKKEDPRETGRRRNLREAQDAKYRRERRRAFSKTYYGDHPPSPPKNPKEGDTYKKPFGPLMIFKNGKFVRA